MSPSSLLLLSHFPILSLIFFSFLSPGSAAGVITSFSVSNSPWGPTNGTDLISKNGTFSAGFQKTTSNDSYFFRVWVTNSRDKFVVWSIFRDSPFDSTTQFSISSKGELFLTNISSNQTLWSVLANSSSPQLVLTDNGELQFNTWSSFNNLNYINNLNDTILPNQTIPKNSFMKKGQFRFVNASMLLSGLNDSYYNTIAIVNLTNDGQLKLLDGTILVASDYGKTDRLRRLTLDPNGISNI